MSLSLPEILADCSPDDAAAFVGYLVLEAGDDAEIDPALETHVARFISLAGLANPDLDDEGRQAAVDAFFRAHPIPVELEQAFGAHVEAIGAGLARGAAREQRAATSLLGASGDLTPVGQTRVEGAMRGGVAGLLQARSSTRKK